MDCISLQCYYTTPTTHVSLVMFILYLDRDKRDQTLNKVSVGVNVYYRVESRPSMMALFDMLELRYVLI